MNNLAIIPARSGSKGLQDKNIKELMGKPLIAYTIEAAKESGCFCEIMVSTDSEKYASIARSYGARAPFLRSQATSSDSASSWDMVDEVLNKYRSQGKEYDTFCLLQPTSPLRSYEDIIEAYKIYNEKASFAVVSVCEAEHSPLWCGHLPESKELNNFISEERIKQRQAGDVFFRLNGAIYILNIKRYRSDRFLYKKGSFAYVMPQSRSVDIDTDIDFKLAEILLQNQRR